MVLPLLLGLLGSALGPSLGIGALTAGAIGSGLGKYAETGDLEKGIMTGLGSFAGGAIAGKLFGSTAGSALAGGTGPANAFAGGAAGLPTKAALGTMGAGSHAMNFAPKAGLFDSAKALMKTPEFMGSQIGGALGGSLAPGKKVEAEDYYRSGGMDREQQPIPRTMMTPPTSYRPGFDPEWDYGLSDVQSAEDINKYNRDRLMQQGGVVKSYFPRKLAAGGIASLAGDDGAQGNAETGVDAPSGRNEKDVVVEAIRAIRGEVEDPRPALGRFLSMYGEDALRDLVDKVENGEAGKDSANNEGKVEGPGDGMDDRVPAKNVTSGEDVLLADNEYVVPADVVSHLGNGSSDAGAKVLDDMLDRVREARTGKKEQAPAIDAKQALPA